MGAFPYLFRAHYSDAVRGQLLLVERILPQMFPLFMFAAILDTLFVACFFYLIAATLAMLLIVWRHWMAHEQDSTGQVNEGSKNFLDLSLYTRANTALRCAWWPVLTLIVYLLAGDSALGVLIWSTRYQFEMSAHNQERLGYQRPSVSPECSATCVDIRSMAVSQSVYPDTALCVCDLNTIYAVNDAFDVAIALFPGVLVGISLMYGAATLQVQRLNIDYGHASKERDVLVRLRSDSEAPGGFAPPVPSSGTRPQGNLKGAPGRR
ncbi:MAG: hypothetical protein WDW38_009912 [Sanguina aurantia]